MFGLCDIFPVVSHVLPDEPLVLEGSKTSSEPQWTVPKLINQFCPEFRNNHRFGLHPLLLNGHLQTAYSQYVKTDRVPVYYNRVLLDYVDGGYGAVDCVNMEKTISALKGEPQKPVSDLLKGKTVRDEEGDLVEMELPPRTEYFQNRKQFRQIASSKKPMVLLLHGLSGGSQEAYIRLFVKSFVETNGETFDIMVLNLRGCLNTVIRTPRLFCGVWTDDVRYLINEEILKHNPEKEIYMAGFSLGGAVLSNYLAQESRLNPKILGNLKLAMVVSAPWDLLESSRFLSRSFIGREIYSPVLCTALKSLAARNYRMLKQSPLIDKDLLLDAVHSSSSKTKYIKDFDENFTSKLFGFGTHEDYYYAATPLYKLHHIRVPMVIVHADDDPIVGPLTPAAQVKANPFLNLITTPYGGHVCWFKRNNDQWYNEPAAQLFGAFRKNVQGIAEGQKFPRNAWWHEDRLVAENSYSEVLGGL